MLSLNVMQIILSQDVLMIFRHLTYFYYFLIIVPLEWLLMKIDFDQELFKYFLIRTIQMEEKYQ